MNDTTLDRFQILDASKMDYPNKCAVCGSFSGDHGKKYITFGAWIEYFGTIYICTDCFMGAAIVVNLVPQKQLAVVENQVAELQAVVETLISENRNLRDAVDNLRTSRIISPDQLSWSDLREQVKEEPRVSVPVESEISHGDSSGPDQATSEGEAGSLKPTDESGSSNIPNNDDDSPSIGLNIFDI